MRNLLSVWNDFRSWYLNLSRISTGSARINRRNPRAQPVDFGPCMRGTELVSVALGPASNRKEYQSVE